MPEITLDQIDAINAELATLDALADLMICARADELKPESVGETGILISKAVGRIGAIVDVVLLR